MNKQSILREINLAHFQYLSKKALTYHELMHKWREAGDINLYNMYRELLDSTLEKYIEVQKWLAYNKQ